MRRKILRYFFILFGCLVGCSAVNLFLVPNYLLSGGISGIAILGYYLFGLPIGMQILIGNIPLLAAGYKILGKKYAGDVIIGTVMYSLCMDATRFLNTYSLVSDPMLAAIYGGIFTGIGSGIIFRVNGSSGGLDIVAAIVKKYYSLNMGAVIFSFNCLIMLLSAGLFGVVPAMFTLISMFVSSNVTDKVVAGLNNKKAVLLISEKTADIADEIIKEVGRGVTFLRGEGAFTHQRKDVLFVVVNLTQIGKIKLIVDAMDPMAFMIILSANEVMGRGFTIPGARIEKMMKLKQSQEKKYPSFKDKRIKNETETVSLEREKS